jgi:hypothetical protein
MHLISTEEKIDSSCAAGDLACYVFGDTVISIIGCVIRRTFGCIQKGRDQPLASSSRSTRQLRAL